MSRNSARPVKKPLPVANSVDKQAATALDHLERGRFRDAVDCYKILLKTGQRPEWLAGLASAYAGRAKALADKGMRREAIELWRNRAEVCHTALWDGPYLGWLVAEGRVSEVLGYLAARRAAASTAPAGQADDELATLEAQLAPGVLSADDAALTQLPAESLLRQHRPIALAALAAYAQSDGPALDVALAGLPFRSPYRDLRSLLKAMLLWETDRDAARAAMARVPQDGPFESLAAPLRCVLLASGSERLRRWVKLNPSQQLIALDLLGCPHTLALLWHALAGARTDLTPPALFDLMQRNVRLLPAALATRAWQWLAAWATRRGCDSPQIFGKPSRAHQECATALAVEIKGELSHAEDHWLDAVDLLESSPDTNDKLRAAMVLRHMATMKGHVSREGVLDKAGAGYLARSLAFDASDCDVHVQLVACWRRSGDLKKAREHLEDGLRLFPESVALLSEAVETALASGAFKKAATTARRLLALDPLNRKVRSLLGNAHLSHASKHLAAGKLDPARKEIEDARSWLDNPAEQGRLHLLLAWTELRASPERLRLAQLASTAWGGGLAAGWRLLREAQGIFSRVDMASALQLLNEAGINSTTALAPADVLALVQALAQEPPITRKGADPLLPWRKALMSLAAAPLFDAETTLRICEAWHSHQEHELLEQFATAARQRWPQRPIFVYHAVAARFGMYGGIASERDFEDLESAQDMAQKRQDFKLVARIEALFEADDPEPDHDDFDQVAGLPGLPDMTREGMRAMLEMTIKLDGGQTFLRGARAELGDALVRQVEKACGGDKKAFMRRLVELLIEELTGSFDETFSPVVVKDKKPPPKPVKPAKLDPPVAPDSGQGSLFDE